MEPLFDLRTIKELSGDDDSLVLKVINAFIESAPSVCIQMKVAAGQKDYAKINSLTHQIKPNFQLLGMTRLFDITIYIEELAKSEGNIENIEQSINRLLSELDHCIKVLNELTF